MAPLEDVQPYKEHTLHIVREAVKRGHVVYHYHPSDVSLDNAGLRAKARRIESINFDADPYFSCAGDEVLDLASLDVLFFRQDPPYDIAYVTNTFLLQRLEDKVLMVNNPRYIREMPDKLSIFDYPDYLPPTLVSREPDEITAFFDQHKDVVIKPLHSFHGHGITRTQSVDEAIAEAEKYPEPLMFQPFLHEIYEVGSKRIDMIDGEISVAYAFIPREGFIVQNSREERICGLTDKQRRLCNEISGRLKVSGLIFVGLDFIGDYLSEINVGSVGLDVHLDRKPGHEIEAKLMDCVETKRKAMLSHAS